MAIDPTLLKNIIEAALLVNGKPQSVKQLEALFDGEEAAPDKQQIDAALQSLSEDFEGRGIELKQVASGYRIQARQELEPWISRLFQEKAPRYSRALLETLALVAYRQPITRSEIEQVRGVSVSSHIMKTLLEREWVRVVGHREVPGRPAMYATTREFLDYFNISSIEQLPTLSEIKDLDSLPESLRQAGITAEELAQSEGETETAETGTTETEASEDENVEAEADERAAVAFIDMSGTHKANEAAGAQQPVASADLTIPDYAEDESLLAPVSESVH